MGQLKYLLDVVTLELDTERCTGCGMCTQVCPHGVFTLEAGKARISDQDACMECGACALNCPADAIAVQSGVGCANAVLKGLLAGTEPCCDSSDSSEKSCCP